jgi:hypothetical protein
MEFRIHFPEMIFSVFQFFSEFFVKVAVTGVKMPAVRGDGMRGLVNTFFPTITRAQ